MVQFFNLVGSDNQWK